MLALSTNILTPLKSTLVEQNSALEPFLLVYTLLISLGAILNFQWMTSFAERSYTWPKMATKEESSVEVDFAVCSYKKVMFLLYIKRNIFFIQCLYGYVIVTLKLSCKDIPGSMISRANESWFKCKKSAN